MYPESLKTLAQKLTKHYFIGRTGGPNRYGKEFLDEMRKHEIHLPENCNVAQFKYWVLQDIDSWPKCKTCNKEFKKYGISNGVMSFPKYCSIPCYKKDDEGKKTISKIKRRLYADPGWKTKTENKKKETFRKRYGVDQPMQSLEIFEKQQESCFKKGQRIDDMYMIGYEPQVYLSTLQNNYKYTIRGSEFLKRSKTKITWNDDSDVSHIAYPDFFVVNDENESFFVEVKSPFTRENGNYKILKIRDSILELGYNYIIITLYPKKYYIYETFLTSKPLPFDDIEKFFFQ